jgi:electron transfer flavoprotein alpha subunit
LLGSAIGKEALAAAEAADGLIESLAGRIGAALVAERPALVNRWMHRQEHLSLVEAALER